MGRVPRDPPVDPRALDDVVTFVKAQRPRALTKEERLDILMMHARLRQAGEKDICNKIAKLLGRQKNLIQAIWTEYLETRGVRVQTAMGNRTNHRTRFPRTDAVVSLVHDVVRQRGAMGLSTDASDILAYLEQHGAITVDHTSAKAEKASLRSVDRFLASIGLVKGVDGKLLPPTTFPSS
ncbi:Aste57867_15803 [Aphanomyces stellatus]|uniref:Aste57867_15803 protein n=1 Tax=Aphanomyces stellatus TaxID=120398 RepID=A0A485L3Y5_9STRA|nr:hypothetical protein As57867_015747 [Aphanomyces stellatus]VFT92591.1 Aste57867_15803 [Aphanomyces stellatus]